MSYFISSIPFDGFSEIPPVSKVIPFPTIAIGLSLFLEPLYSAIISFAGSFAPAVTDKSECIPSFLICVSFITFKVKDLCFEAIFLASFAKYDGVQIFDGRSPSILTF